ncbi:hypothetical protein BH11VER1_BH11VER1_25040 [soil metagenome]
MKEYAFIHEHGKVPDVLRAVPFLGSFNDDHLDDVLNASSYIKCDAGDFIIEDGAIDSRIYILLRGAVNICKGDKIFAKITEPGEIFGELAVVNEDRRSASVVATEETVCIAVDQKFLQDIQPREEHPAFYAALYEFIARTTAARLQSTSKRLAELEMELNALKGIVPEKKKSSKPVAVKKPAIKKPQAKKSASKPKPPVVKRKVVPAKPKPRVKAKPKAKAKARR